MLQEISLTLKKYKLLSLLIFAAIVLRFVWLDRIPVGMTHDELEYIFSSKTYFFYGTDLSGVGLPLSLIKTQTEGIISAIPAILLAPYYGLLDINQATARLPYILLNIATAAVLFNISEILFKNRRTSLIIGLLFLISPWSFYLARQVSDVAWALFFYLSGVLFFLKNGSRNLYLGVTLFTLGFFSYHGAKLLFLPITLITLIYLLKSSKLEKASFAKIFSICLIIFFAYYLISLTITDSIVNTRKGDLIISTDFSQSVDASRKSFINNPLINIFENKITLMVKMIVAKYLTSFSPEVLFISGDTRATYRFEYHGLLYLIDFILIPLGLFSLLKKNKKILGFILGLVLVAPISTALSVVDTSVINRSFLLLPVAAILAGKGLSSIYDLRPNYLLGRRIGIIKLLLPLLALNFFVFYFYRYPITGQENYFLSERVVAKYASISELKNLDIVTLNPRDQYLESIFYSPNQNRNFREGYLSFRQNTYKLNGVNFTRDCPEPLVNQNTYIVSTSINCNLSNKPNEAILQQKDAGAIFNIYNDLICKNESLSPWRRYNNLSDYQIESLSKKDFCKSWIASKPN